MTSPTWSDVLTALVGGRDLTSGETAWAMREVMTGSASPAQLAGFLVALRAKGETVEELTALADTMLEHALRIEVPGRTVDLVGTGGDRAHTVNISTMAALVVAGTGTTVVKHGNRAASSSSGSADVLESLGIRLDHPVERVGEIAREVGITFCFAQVFHPSMRHAGAVRRDLGIATTFNFLGPMINPGSPAATAVGVADLRMAPLMAGVFAARGTDALVFRGEDGLDELAPTARSRVWEVRDGVVTEHELDSVAELGLPPAQISDLRGADAAYNADVARRVLDGERGPVRDAVVLNAAAGLVADGSVSAATGSLTERLGAAMDVAARAIDDGAAADVLARWRSAAA